MTNIIAIDFGTTYSGYAFSITPRGTEPQPHLRRWGQEQGLDTPKTPSCILFDHDGTFLHFGYKAKSKYLDMNREEAAQHYYFENFKMELYNKIITNDLEIKDKNRRPMGAMKVFSAALRFLKEDALKTISACALGTEFSASDFTWVLTVPAIWDFSARQFMRDAAFQYQHYCVQAGIVTPSTGNKFVIALESEAASVWSKTLPVNGFINDHRSRNTLQQATGTQYIVMDCGGGTIDITVHEVLEGGALKEIHKASGNDKGGQRVNRKFTQSLRELFCDGLWEEYERDHRSEAQKMMYDFETVKLTAANAKMNCCSTLRRLVHQRQSKDREVFNEVEGMTWDDGKLLISRNKMETFFYESLVHITDSLYEILLRHPDIRYILLVGGFAQSPTLREHVQKEFSDRAQVLCPKNPQEAILKGAVMFGKDPSVIRSRKSAFTYGVGETSRFDAAKHKKDKMFTTKDGVWCKNLFLKLVGIDEEVEWNETKRYTFYPLERDWRSMRIRFYRTERKNVTYVDDWAVDGPIASCVVEMDISKGWDNAVQLEVFFGSTEIKAKVTHLQSKNTSFVKMDFTTKP